MTKRAEAPAAIEPVEVPESDEMVRVPSLVDMAGDLEGNDEPEVAPPADNTKDEVQETPPETLEAPISDVEKEARDLGWVSKEEFKGKAENWREANAFLERKGMADTIHRLKNDMRHVTTKFNEFLHTTDNTRQQETEEKAAQILELKRQAIKRGNVEEAEKLEEVYHSYKKNIETDKVNSQNNLSEEIQSFKDRNQEWFNTDNVENKTMTVFAVEKDKELRGRHPDWDENSILSEVETSVKNFFPHRFKQPAPRAPQVANSSVDALSISKSKNKSYSYKDLPRDIQQFVNVMTRYSPITKDEYAAQLYKNGTLKK